MLTLPASICFDGQEEVIVGGSSSGTIKLWDLDQGKGGDVEGHDDCVCLIACFQAIRTLLGHRTDCLSVDFHPYGAFFASGSLDTNLKVRSRLSCSDLVIMVCCKLGDVHARSGTSGGKLAFKPTKVTCKESPPFDSAPMANGLFLSFDVKGSEDGQVKLWDLTAGKILCEYEVQEMSFSHCLRPILDAMQQHDGSITSVDFHPSELVMISGSMDRTIKVIDLDELKTLRSTPPEGMGILQNMFSPDGQAVLSVTGDYLKELHEFLACCLTVWKLDGLPLQTCVSILHLRLTCSFSQHRALPSDNSLDNPVAISCFQLVACTTNQCFVQVWALNLPEIHPWRSESSYPAEEGDKASSRLEISPDDDTRADRTSEKEKAKKEAMEMQKKTFLAAQAKAKKEREALERIAASPTSRQNGAEEKKDSSIASQKTLPNSPGQTTRPPDATKTLQVMLWI
eukprot:766132-Hanusia_phi.AAC.3